MAGVILAVLPGRRVRKQRIIKEPKPPIPIGPGKSVFFFYANFGFPKALPTNWQIVGQICQIAGWLAGWLLSGSCLAGCLAAGWMAGWLAGRPAGLLAGWLLPGWPAGWMTGWLATHGFPMSPTTSEKCTPSVKKIYLPTRPDLH